ncbi:hypothetical protein OAC50_00475 [bacterium]|nr:hypothetical protein [bacterium]|tara:strand:+ start:454 stop:621 length:168 start_codon:yes stop_codon:yes gene_type:complete
MASSLRYIIQSVSTNEYLTDSGWSSKIADAKRFITSDLDGLSIGEYILHTVYTIT